MGTKTKKASSPTTKKSTKIPARTKTEHSEAPQENPNPSPGEKETAEKVLNFEYFSYIPITVPLPIAGLVDGTTKEVTTVYTSILEQELEPTPPVKKTRKPRTPKPQVEAPFRYVSVEFVVQNKAGFDANQFAQDLAQFAAKEHAGIMISGVAVTNAVLQRKRIPA